MTRLSNPHTPHNQTAKVDDLFAWTISMRGGVAGVKMQRRVSAKSVTVSVMRRHFTIG